MTKSKIALQVYDSLNDIRLYCLPKYQVTGLLKNPANASGGNKDKEEQNGVLVRGTRHPHHSLAFRTAGRGPAGPTELFHSFLQNKDNQLRHPSIRKTTPIKDGKNHRFGQMMSR